MDPNDILEYFRGRTDEIVALIREVVDIESPSHDSVQSREVADWVERQVRATGVPLTVERVFVTDGNHLIIRAFPGPGKPTLLLGHTDTVHPIGSNAANPTRIEDGRLYGCGVFDMKANIALLIEAFRFLESVGEEPATPLTIVLSCDEEVGSASGREIVEEAASESARCFVMEPSAEGRVKTGRKGTGMFTLKAHGVPAHAGLEPENGANAIAEIARQVDRIHAIGRPDIGTTVNVCKMHGGTTSNVIPDYAECEVDVRFALMTEGERVQAELESLLPVDPRVKLELVGSLNRPPLDRTPEVIGLFNKARDIAAGFGYEIGETQVGGASDGNFVAALGVPLIDGLGLSGGGAHTLQEYVLISDIPERATLLTSLLLSEV